jgi:hypothetical protein
MADEVIANQKTILENQKTIQSNQKTILDNQFGDHSKLTKPRGAIESFVDLVIPLMLS